MPEHQSIIEQTLFQLTQMSEAEMEMGLQYFKPKTFKKGDFFNARNTICRHLVFVQKGWFRVYYNDIKTDEEINLFFFFEHQFMASFKSFIAQIPCHYHIQAMEDAEVLQICYDDLVKVYAKAHSWERFGRILAEQYFYFSQERTESFAFKSPEQRYLEFIALNPNALEKIPLYQLASYLGIKSPSLSRIRKRLASSKHTAHATR